MMANQTDPWYLLSNTTAPTTPDNASNTLLVVTTSRLPLPSEFLVIYFILQGMELTLAAIGNFLTIVAIARFKDLHTATNLLLASLAMADLSAVIALPFELWTFGETRPEAWNQLCLVSQILGRTSTLGNCVFTTLVALDRFVFINHPLNYHTWVTWERARAGVLLSWAGLCGTVLALYAGAHVERAPDGYCFDVNNLHRMGKLVFFVLLVGTFLLTLGLYGKVAMVARRHQRQIEAEQRQYGVTYPVGKERRITSTMGTILGFYVVTTVPTLTLGPLFQAYNSVTGDIVTRCFALLKKGNTFINPIVYAWRSPEFRQAFLKILRMRTTQVASSSGSQNVSNVQIIYG